MMKRRILSLIIAMMCMVTLLTGCSGKIEGSDAYVKAYKSLAETTLTEEGTYAVTEDLVIALEEADFTEPKNIIYMIGDGMGKNIMFQHSFMYRIYGQKTLKL
jgi:alkaline phosphatase